MVDLLARPLHGLTGPILAKELRVASRRKRLYGLRLLYLIVMTLILVPLWAKAMTSGDDLDNVDTVAYRMADVGRSLVPAIVWIQYVAVQVVAMLSMSTSISDEISRRTLGALLTTPLTAWQLVMGKLASRLVQCVGLLAMSLPILALLTVFGGVEWSFVLIGLALTLSTMLIVSSVTMFFSILNRRPYIAFLEALLTLAMLLGGPILMGVLNRTNNSFIVYYDIITTLAAFNPTVSLLIETEITMSSGSGPMWMLPWWVCVAANVVFAALMLSWCVRIVRGVALASAMGVPTGHVRRMDDTESESATWAPSPGLAEQPPPFVIALLEGKSLLPPLKSREAALEAVPTTPDDDTPPAAVKSCTGNPVYWKDTIHRRTGYILVAAIIVMGLLLFSYLATIVIEYEHTFPRKQHLAYVFLLGILGTLVAIVVSASGIPAEREARSWDMVLASPLTNGQIVRGKFLAALRRFGPAYIPLGLHVVLFTLTGSLRPVVLLHVAAIVVGSAMFIAALGVLIGTRVRSTTTAMVTIFLLLLFLWVGAPLLTMMAEDRQAGRFDGTGYTRDYPLSKAVADANPFVQFGVIGLDSHVTPRQLWIGRTEAEHRYQQGYGWPTGNKDVMETTKFIVLTAGGYLILAAVAFLLAHTQVRRGKR